MAVSCTLKEEVKAQIKSLFKKRRPVLMKNGFSLITSSGETENIKRDFDIIIQELKEENELSLKYLQQLQDEFEKYFNTFKQTQEKRSTLMIPLDSNLLNQDLYNIYLDKTFAFKFMEISWRKNILENIFFNRNAKDASGIILNSKTATSNLIKYQTDLFKQIVKFLQERGKLSKARIKMFENNGNNYQYVLKIAEDYIDTIQDSLKESESNIYIDFFNNVVMLSKFDYLLSEYFSGIVQIQGAFKGVLYESSSKYSIETIAKDMSTMSYEDTKRFSSDEMQTNWFKLIAQTIPYIDSNYKQTGEYLTGAQIQLNMAALHQDFVNFFYNSKYEGNSYLESKSLQFLDLTNNPKETFKIIYKNNELRKKIEKNDTLRSLFYYLMGGVNNIEELSKPNENVTLKPFYINHLDVLKNQTPSLSLFDLFAFEISKARSAEMFLYGTNSKKLNLSGLSHEAQMKEKLEQHMATKRNQSEDIIFYDKSRTEYIIATKNEKKYTIQEKALNKFLELEFKNKDGLKTWTYGIHQNGKKSLIKQLSDLLGFGVSSFVEFDDNGKLKKESQKKLVSLIKDLENEGLCDEWQDIFKKAKPWEVKAKMQTYDSSKNSIPIVQVPSAIYNDLYFLNKFQKNFKTEKVQNIFTDFGYKLFSSENNKNYVGSTAVKIDAKIGHQIKQAQTFTPEENLYVEFKVNFLDQLENGLMYFQPVAYSDKGRIYVKCVNLNNKKNGKTLMELTNDELMKIYFKFQESYYKALEESLKYNWGLVFNKKFNNLKEINDELISHSKSDIYNLINKTLKDPKKNPNKNLEFVLERDFSFYTRTEGGKKITYPALNKTLWKNIVINTDEDWFRKDFDNNLNKFKSKYNSFNFSNKKSETYINLKSAKNLFKNSAQIKTEDQVLERYLIFKNMFTEQYLNLTLSMPFIHGSKEGKVYSLEEEQNFNPLNEKFSKRLEDENTSRFDAFGKRMNGFTATVTPYITNNNNGIIRDIKCAIVEDPRSIVHNFDGDRVNDLESTNGSIFVPGFIAKLMSNSLPGAGQEGVQKNFTVHIGKGYYTQIKDAQFLISNQAIRDSKNNTIDLKKVLKKLCIEQNIDLNTSFALYGIENYFYYVNGQLYKLLNVSLKEGKLTITRRKVVNNELENSETLSTTVNNIYDIWEALGGAYTLSKDIKNISEAENDFYFSESSMELLAQIMGTHKELQEGITHMLAFASTTKCGVANLNSQDTILNIDETEGFNTMNVELVLSGIQNDKNEDVDNNEIKEITQLIAALSQGNSIELSNKIYYEIGTTIKDAFSKLSAALSKNDHGEVAKIVNNLFKTSLKKAERISLAHAIIKAFEDDPTLPFSDPNLYPKFTSVLIQHLNQAAIKRKSSGLHGIMTPQENMIEILERWDEETGQNITYTMSVISELALKGYVKSDNEIKTNDQIIDDYVKVMFPNLKVVSKADIDLEDTVQLPNDFDPNNIPEELQDFVKIDKNNRIKIIEPIILQYVHGLIDLGIELEKVQSASKNLRPFQYVWSQDEKNLEGNSVIKTYNIWTSPFAPDYLTQTSKTINGIIFDKETLSKAFQVHTILLSENLSIDSKFFEDTEALESFTSLLRITHPSLLIFPKFRNQLDVLLKDFIVTVSNVHYNPAEVILPQAHKTIMNTGNTSMSEIMKQGSEFFKNRIKADTEPIKDAFATISTQDFKFGLVTINKNQIIHKDSKDSENSKAEYKDATYMFNTVRDRNDNVFVTDAKGNHLFQIDDCKIYEKNGNYYLNLNDPNLENLVSDLNVVHFSINDKAFNSNKDVPFRITPKPLSQLKNILSEISSSLRNYKIGEESLDMVIESLSVEKTANIELKNIVEITKQRVQEINRCLNDNYQNYLNLLALKKFESWKAQQKVIIARIPGQFRSSFMSCKNVGYTGSDLNNIYCNKFLMWIQGADYDIDVGNIMFFEVNSDGTLACYNNFKNISDYDSLSLLSPNKNLYKKELFTDEELTNYDLNIQEKIKDIIKTSNLKIDRISKILKLFSNLEKINKENFNNLKFSSSLDVETKDLLEEINRYNKQPIRNKAVRNIILYEILQSTDDISNMASSYRSVDILTKQIKNIAKDKIKKEHRDIKDGTSIYYVQEINNDGKKTVGIYANAIKGFTALMDYYNNNEVPLLERTINLSIQKGSEFSQVSYNCTGLANSVQFNPNEKLEYDSCDMLSAMLSLAVDNAKELMLSILNAGQEFAGTYSYLIYLGVPMNDIIDFFTQDIVKEVTKESKGFIFNNESNSASISNVISRKIKSLEKSLSDLIKSIPKPELSKLKGLSPEAEINAYRNIEAGSETINYQEIIDIKQKIKVLEDLRIVYNSAQEIRTFTSILKINQGVTNDEIEMIKIKNNFIKQFRDQYKVKFKDINLEDQNNLFILDAAVQQGILIKLDENNYTLGDVNFNKFFDNSNYKEAFCNLYELLKDTFNIYDVIAKSDIYNSLLQKLSDIDEVASKVSFKYKLLSNTQSILIDNKDKVSDKFTSRFVQNITDSEYIKLEQLANDIVIADWLKGINIKLNKRQVYSINQTVNHTNDEYIDLKSAEGIKRFKNLMETFIIPVYLKSSEKYSNNPFVQSLIIHHDKFNGTQNYKLDLNLSKIETVTDQIKRNAIEKGFKELANTDCPILNIDGSRIGTWGELLFVYNVIATKNTFGPNKMTAIFDQYILEQSLNNQNGYVAKLSKTYQHFDREVYVEGYLNNILFTLYNNQGKLVLENNQNEKITLTNYTDNYFSLLEDVSKEEDYKKEDVIDLLMNYIKSDSIRIYLKCD